MCVHMCVCLGAALPAEECSQAPQNRVPSLSLGETDFSKNSLLCGAGRTRWGWDCGSAPPVPLGAPCDGCDAHRTTAKQGGGGLSEEGAVGGLGAP